MLLKRKSKTSAKNLSITLQAVNRSFDNKLGYTNSKRPSKPNLTNVLKPSKLLRQRGFSEPCLVELFRSRNTPDCIYQASPASFGISPKLPKLQNTLCTLKMCGLCLGTNLLSRYDNGRGNEKRLE